MEFLTIVAGVLVGTLLSDVLVAVVITVRAKKRYVEQLDQIRRLVGRRDESEETPGQGYM